MKVGLAFDFLDTLCEAVGVANVIPYLTNDEWKGHLAEPIINQLESLVDNAKSSVKNDSSDGIKVGKRLLKDARPLLKELKSAISNDIRYQMTADKVGNTVLQCAINCYNDSDDKQIARDALDLAKKAKSVVVSKMAKDRCDENIAILQKAVDHLPPEEVSAEAKAIKEIIANMSAELKNVRRILAGGYNGGYNIIDDMLRRTKPHLQSMKKKIGADNAYYLMTSTRIANAALSMLISFVNGAQDFAVKLAQDPILAGNGARAAFTDLKENFENAWKVIQKMDQLDMTDEFKERYDEQRSTLKGLCSKVGVATPGSNVSGSGNSGCMVLIIAIILFGFILL